MAVTLTEEGREAFGDSRALCWGTITWDSSYPASGGEAIDAIGDLGYEKVVCEGGSIVVKWDKANQKLLAFWGNGSSASLLPEVTSTTDLSAVVTNYIAIAIA